jgi:hypothetical protein
MESEDEVSGSQNPPATKLKFCAMSHVFVQLELGQVQMFW